MLSTASWKKNSWSTCQSVIISDIGIREPDVGIDIQRKMKSFHIFWLITSCYTWFLIKFTDIHSPICVNKGTDINLPVLVVIWHVSLWRNTINILSFWFKKHTQIYILLTVTECLFWKFPFYYNYINVKSEQYRKVDPEKILIKVSKKFFQQIRSANISSK